MIIKLVSLAVFVQLISVFAFKLEDLSLLGANRRDTVCTQKPIELGIVLDSSSSIATEDFQIGIKFLKDFLQEFDIGTGRNDVRVSIITYGFDIYPDLAFNLTTHSRKEKVIDAIGHIPHMYGNRTDTYLAIKYMREAQLIAGVVRPGVPKVGLVITDGNSTNIRKTEREAKKARADNIIMFAIGVGGKVNNDELLRIAGDDSRVIHVNSYGSLNEIKEILANKTCIKKPKPTTLPPHEQPCCIKDPADIYFVFSQFELGLEATEWTTNFISVTIDAKDLINDFRYGVVSGSCPDDAGFDLNAYDYVADIRARVQSFKNRKLPSLVQSLVADGYTAARGARAGARKVAVIVAGSSKNFADLQAEVNRLVADGVTVFIADPTGKGIFVTGATTLFGERAGQQSVQLVNALCPQNRTKS